MKFDILTLFPEYFHSVLDYSMMGKAKSKGIYTYSCTNIRDFSENKHLQVDDTPYGGGEGMLMMAKPIVDAYESLDILEKSKFVYLSPQGKLFNNEMAKEFAQFDQIVLLCGHYEGVDQRVLDILNPEEISIGDYILTGGELPALVLMDSVSRFLEGVLGNENSFKEDSLEGNLLKHPQYTKPREYRNLKVPETLLSGHHQNIKKWKMEKSIEVTKNKRYDLYLKYKEKEKN